MIDIPKQQKIIWYDGMEIPKYAEEDKLFEFDYSDAVNSGEDILSATVSFELVDQSLVETTAFSAVFEYVSDNIVYIRISGGTIGMSNLVKIQTTDSLSNIEVKPMVFNVL